LPRARRSLEHGQARSDTRPVETRKAVVAVAAGFQARAAIGAQQVAEAGDRDEALRQLRRLVVGDASDHPAFGLAEELHDKGATATCLHPATSMVTKIVRADGITSTSSVAEGAGRQAAPRVLRPAHGHAGGPVQYGTVTKGRDTRACVGVARPTIRFASLVGSLPVPKRLQIAEDTQPKGANMTIANNSLHERTR